MYGSDALARLNLQLAQKTESTDNATLLTLLLRTIQKLPKFAEAKSRELLPLFLAFVGRAEEGSRLVMETASDSRSDLRSVGRHFFFSSRVMLTNPPLNITRLFCILSVNSLSLLKEEVGNIGRWH